MVPESLPTPAVNMAFPWGMTLPPPKLKIPGEAILLFDAGGAKLNPPCAGAVNTNGEKEERKRKTSAKQSGLVVPNSFQDMKR